MRGVAQVARNLGLKEACYYRCFVGGFPILFDPRDGDADRLMLEIPAGGAPAPVFGSCDEAGADGI